MDIFFGLIDFVLHLDSHLGALIREYGILVYLIIFLIIFIETGLVVAPFLPGDSLIFAAGAFAAVGSLNLFVLFVLLGIAAILGDTVNYWIGHFLGPKIFHSKTRFLNKKQLDRTHKFYEKHGGATIVIARFIPIIRTFAPFLAGIGKMSYWRFVSYNVAGGVAWIAIFLSAGYYFSSIPFVKDNFSLVIIAIILISLIPAAIEFIRHCRSR